MNNNLVIGIDASRNRSGGAKAHLIGILTEIDPHKYGIKEVHLWSFKSLLDEIPDHSWLIKHNPGELELSLPRQLWWQAKRFSSELSAIKCDLLFTTCASSLCRFKPVVVFSQDMLSYEPGAMRYFGYTLARLRLIAILFIQNQAFRRADGVIFLTKYAGKVIQKSCGSLPDLAYIPHGIGDNFKRVQQPRYWPTDATHPIQCIYVSNTEMYKHQWVVVRAIEKLQERGHNINLLLVGGGAGRAQKLLEQQLAISDPNKSYVNQTGFVPQVDLPQVIAKAHIFLFASSCENMPITLLEGMSMGLPIACSDRGPMPEVLNDGGVYFDPEDDNSVANALEQIIINPELRLRIAQRAKEIASKYTWARCADETFTFIREIYQRVNS